MWVGVPMWGCIEGRCGCGCCRLLAYFEEVDCQL